MLCPRFLLISAKVPSTSFHFALKQLLSRISLDSPSSSWSKRWDNTGKFFLVPFLFFTYSIRLIMPNFVKSSNPLLEGNYHVLVLLGKATWDNLDS